MREINYLKNKIEFSIKNNPSNPSFKITQNDIDAINGIINAFNNQKNLTNLEESLILFYILTYWKVENKNNELKLLENKRGVFEITSIYNLFEKLFLLVDPKEQIIENIFTEIRVHQLMNKVEKKHLIKKTEITKLLNDSINAFAVNFKPLKQLFNINTNGND